MAKRVRALVSMVRKSSTQTDDSLSNVDNHCLILTVTQKPRLTRSRVYINRMHRSRGEYYHSQLIITMKFFAKEITVSLLQHRRDIRHNECNISVTGICYCRTNLFIKDMGEKSRPFFMLHI